MECLHSQVYQFGKSFQYCHAAAEELFRVDKVNELQRDLREMMRLVEPQNRTGIKLYIFHPINLLWAGNTMLTKDKRYL